MLFEYGKPCPVSPCSDLCMFEAVCSAVSDLIEAGHSPDCACNTLSGNAVCICGKVK